MILAPKVTDSLNVISQGHWTLSSVAKEIIANPPKAILYITSNEGLKAMLAKYVIDNKNMYWYEWINDLNDLKK